MTTVAPLGPPSPGSSPGGLGALTPQDFLTLLVAQVTDQNPLDPTSTSQFMAQTAELSTLEQMATLSQEMGQVLRTEQDAEAASLLGKQVSAVSSSGQAVSGAVTAVDLASSVPTVTVAGTALPLSDVAELS